jgi:hypothetical protein
MIATPRSAQQESERNTDASAVTAGHSQYQPSGTSQQDDIARLAYALWQQRGCPVGSAEFDWFEAEEKLVRSAEGRESSGLRR